LFKSIQHAKRNFNCTLNSRWCWRWKIIFLSNLMMEWVEKSYHNYIERDMEKWRTLHYDGMWMFIFWWRNSSEILLKSIDSQWQLIFHFHFVDFEIFFRNFIICVTNLIQTFFPCRDMMSLVDLEKKIKSMNVCGSQKNSKLSTVTTFIDHSIAAQK
jgi:hypothetical protein